MSNGICRSTVMFHWCVRPRSTLSGSGLRVVTFRGNGIRPELISGSGISGMPSARSNDEKLLPKLAAAVSVNPIVNG